MFVALSIGFSGFFLINIIKNMIKRDAEPLVSIPIHVIEAKL